MSVLGRRLSTVGTAAAGCALLVLSSGCGGGDGEAAGDGTTTSTSETTIASTTTTQDPEAEVEAAYLAYWEMQRRLAEAPNPSDPEVRQRTTGPALDKLVDSLTTMRSMGQTLRFGPRYSHKMTSVDLQADRATVRDCAVDDGTRVTANGEETSLQLSTSLLETTLVDQGRDWLVESISELESWDGATSCEQ
jgi:hypothetical protein